MHWQRAAHRIRSCLLLIFPKTPPLFHSGVSYLKAPLLPRQAAPPYLMHRRSPGFLPFHPSVQTSWSCFRNQFPGRHGQSLPSPADRASIPAEHAASQIPAVLPQKQKTVSARPLLFHFPLTWSDALPNAPAVLPLELLLPDAPGREPRRMPS